MTRKDFIRKTSAAAAATGFAGCMTATAGADKLALFGGAPVMGKEFAKKNADMFRWPIVNDAMRKASDDVLRGCIMSGTDITKEFEKKFSAGKVAITDRKEETVADSLGYICIVNEMETVIGKYLLHLLS